MARHSLSGDMVLTSQRNYPMNDSMRSTMCKTIQGPQCAKPSKVFISTIYGVNIKCLATAYEDIVLASLSTAVWLVTWKLHQGHQYAIFTIQGLYQDHVWCKYQMPSHSLSEDNVLTRMLDGQIAKAIYILILFSIFRP